MRIRLWMPAPACPLRTAPGPVCCTHAPDCPLDAPCPLRLCPADTEYWQVQVTHGGILADLGVPDAVHAAEVLDAVEEAGETDLVVWGLPGPHPEEPVVVRGALSPLLVASMPHSHLVSPSHLHAHGAAHDAQDGTAPTGDSGRARSQR